MGTDTRIDSIIFGCALAVRNSPVADGLVLVERRWKSLYFPGALLVLFGCLVPHSNAFRETIRYSLQGLALSIIFVAAIRYPHWILMRILNSRPLVVIGVLSYSLYLLHYAVIFEIRAHYPEPHPILQGIDALGICLLCASVMYAAIERPCARLRRRLDENGRSSKTLPIKKQSAVG